MAYLILSQGKGRKHPSLQKKEEGMKNCIMGDLEDLIPLF